MGLGRWQGKATHVMVQVKRLEKTLGMCLRET